MLANLARSITAAITSGVQKSAETLVAAVPKEVAALLARTAASMGSLPSSVPKLTIGAANSAATSAACLTDLSQVTLKGSADSVVLAMAQAASLSADLTNTKSFFMGQPGGGGGGNFAVSAGNAAANSNAMSSALAAQRAASAANS